EAAGIEFKIRPLDPPPPEQPPPLSEFASLNGIINNLEAEGFSIAHSTDQNGVTTVLVFHSGGGFIETGPQTILGLAYQIGSEAPPEHPITLEISDVVLSDTEAVSIDQASEDGLITIGVVGDIVGGDFGAGDGNVNVLDITKTIKYVLAILPTPDSEDDPFLFWALDVNSDGNLDVLDIVGMVNLFLYGDEEPPEIKSVVRQPIVVGLEDGQSAEDGYVHVPITFDATSQLGGLQAVITFDPSRLAIGPASLFGGIEGLTFQHHVVDGRLKILLYSLDGQALQVGRHAITVPVRLRDSAQSDGWLSLGNVVLSDRNAQSVPVVIGGTSIKITETPGVYSLSSATPNPFNPATTISYVVPRQGHITLTVFNLLGQEIVRLVDSVHSAGTYRAVWSGTDATGREVASGIYLYRLNSATGFTETRRMTLLK
ncbi:MAG: T9SS type A sorting domain-containing protein, partial [Candidatus Latescibacteria bacterium]|nr:T9SS type A sorting domain-containing protein [Candidatus Latescibacterota bacterium]